MKVAICLFGISRLQNIDYRKSVLNYKQHLFGYFISKGYEVDVYFCTNKLATADLLELLHVYTPVNYQCIDNVNNFTISRNQKVTNVVRQVIESRVAYDHICVTRFDLLFQTPFHRANINLERFNNVSVLEHKGVICDNFYLFPARMAQAFHRTLLEVPTTSHHYLQQKIEENIQEPIHFITDERVFVRDLSFYKIVRAPAKRQWSAMF